MGWKIIEIDQPAQLKTYNNNLIIQTDKRLSINMADIDVLLISENRINFSVNAVNELINNGVCIILCDHKKLPNSYILGYKVQKQSHTNFLKQAKWTEDYKTICWSWLLFKKINNQIRLLEHFNMDTKYCNDLVKSKPDELIEAQVANYFFRSLFGRGFNRNKDNIVNDILNYGYVVLTNMVARSLIKKGLNLHISFFHGSQYSTYPLAYDVVEVFRIVIDLFTKTLLESQIINRKQTLTSDIKSCLLDFIANYKILIDDKYEFINNAIDKVVDWIIGEKLIDHTIEYDFNLDEIYGCEELKNKI